MPRDDMRLIEVMLLSEAAREQVVGVLETEGLDYNVSDRTDNPHATGLVSFPIPAPNVEANERGVRPARARRSAR